MCRVVRKTVPLATIVNTCVSLWDPTRPWSRITVDFLGTRVVFLVNSKNCQDDSLVSSSSIGTNYFIFGFLPQDQSERSQ